MKISRRLKTGGWSKWENNKSKTHCDVCGEPLFVSPAGDRYCDGGAKGCESKEPELLESVAK